MAKTYFIADLHLGHKNILKFEPGRGGSNIEEHDEWLINQWNSVVNPNDVVWVLGDVSFGANNLYKLARMKGQKKLVMGNHDTYDMKEYLKYFSKIYGLTKYRGYWLSHAPLHEGSMRDKKNIHGHTHSRKLNDKRYICVSVEQNNGIPISFEEILSRE